MNEHRTAFAKRCAICKKGRTKGEINSYPTILTAMGIVGNPFAHTKCILRAQQQALQFRSKITTRS
jgi:hypothetical protein